MDDLIRMIDEVLEDDNLQASPTIWYCLHRLKELLFAQQWIPCSERLPEKDVAVLFLWKRDEELEYDVGKWSWRRVYTDDDYGRSIYTGKDVVAWYGLRYWHEQEMVVAWMPLPEPPEESEE